MSSVISRVTCHLLGEVLVRGLVGLPGRVELRAELRDAGVVDPTLQLGVRVGRAPLGRVGLADEHVELRPVAVRRRAVLAVESVVEAHRPTPSPESP
jgi:hypothetical protein